MVNAQVGTNSELVSSYWRLESRESFNQVDILEADNKVSFHLGSFLQLIVFASIDECSMGNLCADVDHTICQNTEGGFACVCVDRLLYSLCLGHRGLLVVYVFIVFRTFFLKLSRVVSPLCRVQAGHQLQARHKIRCL